MALNVKKLMIICVVARNIVSRSLPCAIGWNECTAKKHGIQIQQNDWYYCNVEYVWVWQNRIKRLIILFMQKPKKKVFS